MKIRTGGIIVSALAFALVLKAFCFDLARVDGVSMEPFLSDGDAVFVLTAAYGLQIPFSGSYFLRWAVPAVGDVVVFRNPKTGCRSVKRCQAVGPLDIAIAPGRASLGDRQVDLNPAQEALLREYGSLPEGFAFLAGDNSADSVDSRDYGFVSIDALSGMVMFGL